VVRAGGGVGDVRVIAERAEVRSGREAAAGLDVEDRLEEGMGDQDVVDELDSRPAGAAFWM
jgi:hypothetical protein